MGRQLCITNFNLHREQVLTFVQMCHEYGMIGVREEVEAVLLDGPVSSLSQPSAECNYLELDKQRSAYGLTVGGVIIFII